VLVNILLVALIASLTLGMAALGGQLAASKGWHKWFFWLGGAFCVVLMILQAYRTEMSIKDLDGKRQQFEDHTTQQLQQIIDHPVSQEQKAAAVGLKNRMADPSTMEGGLYSPNSLSRMSPLELRFYTQAFCEKLRGFGKKWDSEYQKNYQTYVDAMKSAKTEQEQNSYAAKRMADNEASLRRLRDEFNEKYFRDAQAFKVELLKRVSKVVIRGGGPSTGPGYSEPLLPPPSVLLEYGDTAGADPFSEAADYLENLAKRLT
jgi:hypothetical protein